MRAYADTLIDAMARHAPEMRLELVELDPEPASGLWRQRLQTVTLPARAWLQRRRAPDLWHVLDGSRAFVARTLGSKPVVITVHDIIPWLQGNGRFENAPSLGHAARSLWRSNGRALREAELLVCVSAATERDIQREVSVPPMKSRVVHHILRPSMVDRLESTARIERQRGLVLHVGNNGFYKNRDGVLRIFSRLEPGVASRLVMAGPRPDARQLALAQSLGISDRIEWMENPNDDSLAAAYRRASVLLFPSLYEGFGWPVLEAMAFGLPVVASDAGSIREVAGDAAEFLPVDDEAALAAAVRRLLESARAAETAAVRGLARAADFNSAAFARQMRDAYRLAGSSRKTAIDQ
jgi:glycosyltransferase involved in cell wall biosynthesis